MYLRIKLLSQPSSEPTYEGLKLDAYLHVAQGLSRSEPTYEGLKLKLCDGDS